MTPHIQVLHIERRVQMVQTRMPFRFGSAKLERCPHLFLIATIRDQHGNEAQGIASDHLSPKWFDKDPTKTHPQELRDQRQVIDWASQAALSQPSSSAFQLWREVYHYTQQQAGQAGLPPLLGGFGPSLIERTLIDAVGRLLNLPFHQLLHTDALGIQLGDLDAAVADTQVSQIVPAQPLQQIWSRHTVGLIDPIRTGDIPDDERLNDGLPQSLEEVVAQYGVRYFKIKVQNQLDVDLARLTAIAQLLDEQLATSKYFCTLDGNEQYNSMDELQPLLEALRTKPVLRRLAASILFIEQPLARAVALDATRCQGLNHIVEQFPVIIDESDDTPSAFARALQLGYSGTSHKNCKNTFKSVLNLARVQAAQSTLGRPLVFSAEDLTNIDVALNQDLTALSTLGIPHAERNGPHYFRGLSHLSQQDQAHFLAAHPDVYQQDNDFVRVRIQEGKITLGSLHQTAGLGNGAWPSWEALPLLEDLDPESLI
jgi:L-alanine-DL-glutamate epimerase-like enolase superfamily enzyme